MGQESYSFKSISKHRFTDGNNIGPLHDFRLVFQSTGTDRVNFHKFNKIRKFQSTSNLALLITTSGFAILDSKNGADCNCDGSFAKVSAVFFGSLFLVSNAFMIPIKSKRKKKLLNNYFSRTNETITFHEKSALELHTQLSGNGIGIIIKL